jgi:hypothetical protein
VPTKIAQDAGATLPFSFRLPREGERDPTYGLTRNAYYQFDREGLIKLRRLTTPGKSKGRTLVLHSEVQALLQSQAKVK